MLKNGFLLCCVLLSLLLLSPLAALGEAAEEAPFLELTPGGRLNFYNGTYHYVTVNAECRGADQLVMRVYKPDGSPFRFSVRRMGRNGVTAGMTASFAVDGEKNWLSGSEVLFSTKCTPGIWQIEVTALKDREEVAAATLRVTVLSAAEIRPGEYDIARAMLTGEADGQNVIAGKIRFVTQMPNDHCFEKRYWRSKYYDLTGSAQTKCTRAVLSMGLSWLGVDCTPVRMSEMTKAQEIYYTYEHVIEALGNVEQVEGEVEALWDHYMSGAASPVEIHFTYEGGMHALLLIHRDRENPDIYYAVNPGDGVNATEYGGEKHDHIIPLLIEEGRIGAMIQSPLVKRFNKGKLDLICQWKLLDEDKGGEP